MGENPKLDLGYLFKLRLVVARVGEMDNARWWNTQGQLGRMGATVLKRGFPRTYRFVQARSVFAAAAHRCAEVFNPPECVTLWNLPADIEEAFDEKWHDWLDTLEEWEPVFSQVEALQGSDLLEALKSLDLVTPDQEESVKRLKRSTEGRAVLIPSVFEPTDAHVAMLAGAFSRGEPGQPAIPYARLA